MAAAIWLLMVLAGVAVWTVNDTRQYRVFRRAADSSARRAFYWRWTLQSLAFLTGASVISFGLIGRFDALLTFPIEFAPLAAALQLDTRSGAGSADQRLGMVLGFSIGILILIATARRRIAKMVTPVIGDIEPLIPRNTSEMLAALPLCLNAGFSEELFFRLALPLLITTVTDSAAISCGISILVFGLIHWYQGWKGVLATTFAGGVLTLVYLKSGSIAKVMVVHAFIDVVALIIRPMIASRYAAWTARSPLPL
jgi:membrane protease YdiL (CAAX protease family)